MSNQFYPTGTTLAFKAHAKFKNKEVTRILEPSAGRGNLLVGFGFDSRYSRIDKVDCIELDFDNQAILRKKGFRVIDTDFLQSDLHGLYSHIIMNPPFNQGAEHIIKAFNLLANGELVAILNAETIKNQHTAQRKHLAKLVEDYGTVEYLQDAFTDPDTLRKTSVEIALIHMERKADIKQNFTHGLDIDKARGVEYKENQGLAIKDDVIGNAVAVFNAAVTSLKSAEIAREEANYYANWLGQPINQMQPETDVKLGGLQERFNDGYDTLRKRAWTNVLNSTEFNKYLSSNAYRKLVDDFEQVAQLSFTESNIRGFLCGLVSGQADMNMQMLLDTFDEITKYRPDNRAYYRGWKSNSKHQTQAWQIKMTRFVIPVGGYSWSTGLDYSNMAKLRDFDKTFAMLDGKAESENSLYNLFNNNFASLAGGARVSTDYFDVRYYAGVKTIHFFPTNKKLIERLNLLCGRQRQWLPQDDEIVSPVFWEQYQKAEMVTKNMPAPKNRYGQMDEECLPDAHLAACKKLNIDVNSLLALEN